eukprot:3209357-Pyramimonas_sp.AAC.1
MDIVHNVADHHRWPRTGKGGDEVMQEYLSQIHRQRAASEHCSIDMDNFRDSVLEGDRAWTPMQRASQPYQLN